MFQICQGEYLVYISNDILVTKNWAEILLTCLKSDPTAPGIDTIFLRKELPALGQCVLFDIALLCRHAAKVVAGHSPTNDPDAFVRWADGQNRSDPL